MPGRARFIALLVLLASASLSGCQPARVARSWSTPHTDLISLPGEPRVRYTAGARVLAQQVAATLPQQVNRVETAGERMFLGPVEVRVYARVDDYRTECAATAAQISTLSDDAVCLSPALARTPTALPDELAYQLTRLYLRQYTGSVGWYTYVPDWFTTGYAQLVANRTPVTRHQAAAAILAGHHFVPRERANPLERRPDLPLPLYRSEAKMFVDYLRGQNPAAFRQLLHRVMERHWFQESFAASYGGKLAGHWRAFVASLRG